MCSLNPAINIKTNNVKWNSLSLPWKKTWYIPRHAHCYMQNAQRVNQSSSRKKPHSACDKLPLVLHQTWTMGNGTIRLSRAAYSIAWKLLCTRTFTCIYWVYRFTRACTVEESHSCRKHCSARAGGRTGLNSSPCVRGKESNRAAHTVDLIIML